MSSWGQKYYGKRPKKKAKSDESLWDTIGKWMVSHDMSGSNWGDRTEKQYKDLDAWTQQAINLYGYDQVQKWAKGQLPTRESLNLDVATGYRNVKGDILKGNPSILDHIRVADSIKNKVPVYKDSKTGVPRVDPEDVKADWNQPGWFQVGRSLYDTVFGGTAWWKGGSKYDVDSAAGILSQAEKYRSDVKK